jgi:membrane peptidoglycan carboxypeptidase
MSTDYPRPEEDEGSYHLESPSPGPPSSEHNKRGLEEQVAHITPRFPPVGEDKDDDDEPTLKMPPVHRKKPTSDTPPRIGSMHAPQAEQPIQQMEGYKEDKQSQLPVLPEISGSLPSVPLLTTREQDLLHLRKYRQLYLRRLSRKRSRRAREASRQQVNRIWITLASVLLVLLALMITLTGVSSYVMYGFYNQTQSQYSSQMTSLRDLVPKDNLKIYDSQGILLTELTGEGLHTSVSLKQVSQAVINATVSTEDKNFWTNSGIDIARIFQAAYDDLRSGQPIEGGSTITQQLIKNLVVGNQTTLLRKMQEVALTPIINQHYSKSDILEMYLNTVYYGEQAYGIDAAARVYFGLQDSPGHPAASQLDLAQSAMLAGIINSPTGDDPWLYPQNAFNRFDYVMTRMQADGYINRTQALNATKEAHSVNFFKHVTIPNRAPHFTNFVVNQLEQSLHLTLPQLSRSDMSVYTTLNITLQDQIQKIMQNQVATLSAQGHNVSNAAEVLIDFHTGAIISLLGSIDYNNTSIDGQFDVATQGYRQPGSSFKPYVYVTAFAQGASPAQAIGDTPLTIDTPGGPPFTPTNYDNRYHGQMTLRCALQNSLNIPAVKVLQHVGIDNAMQMAKNMGISSYNGTPGYSLVLGGLGVHLLDHTSAMGTFANGGVHVPYYAIQQVTLASTNRPYIVHKNDPGQYVISPQLAYMMTNVLSDNTSRLPEFFDCNPLQLYSNSQTACYEGDRGTVRPAAVKTGTTNDFRDNWTMGYTTDYVMGVWTGNDDYTPMINVTGVQGAAPIWHDSMLLAEQGHPIRDFTNPGGLQQATVRYSDGVQATDWFMPGTVPATSPAPPQQVTIPGFPFPIPVPVRTAPQAQPYCPNDFSLVNGDGGAPSW